jgi:hypothetical protein
MFLSFEALDDRALFLGASHAHAGMARGRLPERSLL